MDWRATTNKEDESGEKLNWAYENEMVVAGDERLGF